MSETDERFVRCAHCRGFYPEAMGACIYCLYETPMLKPDGEVRVWEDRAACRAVQVAEWRRLPQGVREDPMGPPEDEFEELCGCLHCGPSGPPFEAIEMRWMENEGMWACPCTRCGGRGFHFDIHPLAAKWQCAACGHKWKPPEGNEKPSNCKCPKCGCTDANGWFEDEYTEEEIEAMTEEEYKEAFGQTRAEEEAERVAFDEQWKKDHPEGAETANDDLPWTAEDDERMKAEREAELTYDPEAGLAAERAEEAGGGYALPPYPANPQPDDIDFPHERALPAEGMGGSEGSGEPLNNDDIPW